MYFILDLGVDASSLEGELTWNSNIVHVLNQPLLYENVREQIKSLCSTFIWEKQGTEDNVSLPEFPKYWSQGEGLCMWLQSLWSTLMSCMKFRARYLAVWGESGNALGYISGVLLFSYSSHNSIHSSLKWKFIQLSSRIQKEMVYFSIANKIY